MLAYVNTGSKIFSLSLMKRKECASRKYEYDLSGKVISMPNFIRCKIYELPLLANKKKLCFINSAFFAGNLIYWLAHSLCAYHELKQKVCMIELINSSEWLSKLLSTHNKFCFILSLSFLQLLISMQHVSFFFA